MSVKYASVLSTEAITNPKGKGNPFINAAFFSDRISFCASSRSADLKIYHTNVSPVRRNVKFHIQNLLFIPSALCRTAFLNLCETAAR